MPEAKTLLYDVDKPQKCALRLDPSSAEYISPSQDDERVIVACTFYNPVMLSEALAQSKHPGATAPHEASLSGKAHFKLRASSETFFG